MKKLFCTLLSAAAAVALLCGFTPSPQENSAGAGLITKTYETAEAISSLSVSDKYADVTVKADDVDHVVVEYSYNSSYNDAFGTGGELYSFTIAGPSLNIQGLKGDASMSVNNSKCICTMTVKLPRRAFAGLTVDTSNGKGTVLTAPTIAAATGAIRSLFRTRIIKHPSRKYYSRRKARERAKRRS